MAVAMEGLLVISLVKGLVMEGLLVMRMAGKCGLEDSNDCTQIWAPATAGGLHFATVVVGRLLAMSSVGEHE